jgi:DHA1 family multidrug resistance protein-like MFS transporter
LFDVTTDHGQQTTDNTNSIDKITEVGKKTFVEDKQTLIILSIAISTSVLGVGIIVPFLPVYAESMGANGLWLGIIFAGFSMSRAVFMPIIGKLSDRKGRKLFISVGLLIYSLVSLAYIAAGSPVTLTLVRLGHGFASAMVLPIATAYIADITPKNQEGAYIGYFQAAFFSGFGLGPLMGGFVKDLFGINANFYAMGILSLIAFTLVLLRIPEFNQATLRKNNERTTKYRHMFKSRIIRAIFVIRFTTAFGRGTVLVFFPVFAHSVLHLSSTKIGIVMSIYILLTGILQRPFGKLADHWNRAGMVIFGSLLSICAICLFPLTGNLVQVIVLSLFMALGGGISIPAMTAITVRHGKTMGYGMGMLMGLFYLAVAIGLATGPVLNGVIFDRLGVEAPFFFGGTILFVGTTIFLFFLKNEKM